MKELITLAVKVSIVAAVLVATYWWVSPYQNCYRAAVADHKKGRFNELGERMYCEGERHSW